MNKMSFTNLSADVFYYAIAPYRSLEDLYLDRNLSKGSMNAYLAALKEAPTEEIRNLMINRDDPFAVAELLRRNFTEEQQEAIYEDAFGYGLPNSVRFLLLNYPDVDLGMLIGFVELSYSSDIGEDLYLAVRSLLLDYWNSINDNIPQNVVDKIQRSIAQANRGSDTFSQNPNDYPLYLRDILHVVRNYPRLAQEVWMDQLPVDI